MRELLDRLLEARTALDDKLRKEENSLLLWTVSHSTRVLWMARYHLWKATMLVLKLPHRAPTPAEDNPDLLEDP